MSDAEQPSENIEAIVKTMNDFMRPYVDALERMGIRALAPYKPDISGLWNHPVDGELQEQVSTIIAMRHGVGCKGLCHECAKEVDSLMQLFDAHLQAAVREARSDTYAEVVHIMASHPSDSSRADSIADWITKERKYLDSNQEEKE